LRQGKARQGKARQGKASKKLLFVNKKKQKNFYYGGRWPPQG
jgi:hypothetical protein